MPVFFVFQKDFSFEGLREDFFFKKKSSASGHRGGLHQTNFFSFHSFLLPRIESRSITRRLCVLHPDALSSLLLPLGRPKFSNATMYVWTGKGRGDEIVYLYSVGGSTYFPVQVDGVFARHDIGDGRASGLLPGFGAARHGLMIGIFRC
jgi:hypothetical protein